MIELAAIDVARKRIDHRVPAVAGFEIVARRFIVAALDRLPGSFLGAVIERVERFDKIHPLGERKAGVKALLAPGRAGLVDFEIQVFGDADEPVLIGRMQPAAAEVEGDIRCGHDGMGAAAEPVARFENDDREAGMLQRMRGTEAGGAGADDGDID